MENTIKDFEIYKYKIHGIVDDINLMMEDGVYFPERSGGKFELYFEVNKGQILCKLYFTQDDVTYNVILSTEIYLNEDASDEDYDLFYQRTYLRILRYFMFSEDNVINPGEYIGRLSLKTLAIKGFKENN